MRPGNTRVPLVIAAVAAGLAYICLGRSTPADLLHWLPSLKIAMSGNHQSAKQLSDAADHRSDAHDEDKGDDEDADPDRTTSLTLPDFDGVILNTPHQATIVIGDRQSVVIERDSGTPDLTRASVSGGKLRSWRRRHGRAARSADARRERHCGPHGERQGGIHRLDSQRAKQCFFRET